MQDIAPSDLKAILHSQRANLYYLQHCRVLVNGGRVEYVTDTGKRSLYWNIPIANTTSILLGTGTDAANRFLDHGNYLAYGLGAMATWVLGLPHGLAVLHGKTRRGGLVFDAADLVKDAAMLPQAFLSAMRGDDEQQFRHQCIETLARSASLDFIIDTLKRIAIDTARLADASEPSA